MSDRTKQVLKFEAKLLLGVTVLGLGLFFGLSAFIYTAGHYVAQAYTSEYTQNLR